MIKARTANKSATLYKGKFDEEQITFTRVWSKATAWTFEMHPVKVLLEKYVDNGYNWIDPFAGKNSPAQYTNDHNPANALFYKDKKHNGRLHYHSKLEALDFCKMGDMKFDGVIFDPPYSFTQVKEHYQVLGLPVTKGNTSMQFYSQIKDEVCKRINDGGYAISFGWNTNGFGKARGFKIVEIMAIAHGGHRNDTLVVVEKKDDSLMAKEYTK